MKSEATNKVRKPMSDEEKCALCVERHNDNNRKIVLCRVKGKFIKRKDCAKVAVSGDQEGASK